MEVWEACISEWSDRGFQSESAEKKNKPGVVTGLAWTAYGGEILFIDQYVPVVDIDQGRIEVLIPEMIE